MNLSTACVPGTDPGAVALVAAFVEEVGRLYEPGLGAGPSATPEDLSPPGGCVVLLRDESGEVVAGGGVKRLSSRVCEIKRLYVAPAVRGQGVGAMLLAAVEDAARALGYRLARLDTGARQPEALRLFERAGYRAIPDYNGNPYAAFWGEKAL